MIKLESCFGVSCVSCACCARKYITLLSPWENQWKRFRFCMYKRHVWEKGARSGGNNQWLWLNTIPNLRSVFPMNVLWSNSNLKMTQQSKQVTQLNTCYNPYYNYRQCWSFIHSFFLEIFFGVLCLYDRTEIDTKGGERKNSASHIPLKVMMESSLEGAAVICTQGTCSVWHLRRLSLYVRVWDHDPAGVNE